MQPGPHMTNGQLGDQCPPTLAITGLCRGSACRAKAEILCNLPILRSRWVSLRRRFYRAGAVQPTRRIVDFTYVSAANRLTKRQRVCVQPRISSVDTNAGLGRSSVGMQPQPSMPQCGSAMKRPPSLARTGLSRRAECTAGRMDCVQPVDLGSRRVRLGRATTVRARPIL
jgi:hypothetical protein